MAKFCRYCGTPIEEGQVCTCAEATAAAAAAAAPAAPVAAPAAPVAAPAAPVAPSAAANLMNELKELLLTGLKAPRQAGARITASKNKMALGGIMAGINAITVLILVWTLLANIFSTIGDLLGDFLGSLGSLGDMDSMLGSVDMSMPFFPMLISAIVLAAVGVAISGLFVFVCGKINKLQVNIMDMICVAAADSLLPSALLLVSVIFGFISIKLQLVVLLLMVIVSAVNACENARVYTGIEANRSIKELVITAVGLLVVLGVVALVSKWLVLDWCLMEVEIEGMKLGTLFDGANALGGMGNLFG